MLSYQKLDVYQCAIEFLALSARIVQRIPRGSTILADQLKRAALSIPLNIAEAVGRPSENDRARFLAIARGSAMECGALLDACTTLRLVDSATIQTGQELLVRIVSMLSKMMKLSNR